MDQKISTILVIDDEEVIRNSFADYFEDRDYSVLKAENGQRGLDIIKSDCPDLVLVDLRMPGMDGLEFLKVTSEIVPDLPKIVISGTDRIDDAVLALRLGAWDYLFKPVADLSVLGHTVEKALERARLKLENREYQDHLETLVNERTYELKEAFYALRKSERQYRTLFEKTNDAIFIIHRKNGICLDANEAAAELTGRPLSELKNLPVKEFVAEEDYEQLRKFAFSRENKDLGVAKYRRPDGVIRLARLSILNLDDDIVFGMARDITYEIAMEEQLRQSQKMEAIGTLAGGIAHDFNNILSSILGYTELALLDVEADRHLISKLKVIRSSGERARDLVAQILAFSRNEKQIFSPISVHLILKEALKLLRPAIPATIEIRVEIETEEKVAGDPTRIHQVVMNLCTNAYQAMHETGGVIDISLSCVPIEGHFANELHLPSGSYVKLSIADTGCGISPTNIKRIFDPYFTTKDKGKGTGMGLAVVHGIAKNHGGTIVVESRDGIGTRFDVYLPVASELADRQDDHEILFPEGSEMILLVDDEIDIIKVETVMLEKLGYRVTTARKADEALKIFAANYDKFDLVISDMTMPDMNGVELSKELRLIRSDIKIIICSGHSEMISAQNIQKKNIQGYISKPVSFSELAQKVRSVIGQSIS